MRKSRVVVAMSGGVDSSVAAALLKEEGYEVIGITMQIWPKDELAEEASRFGGCCSLAAVADAKKVAFKLDIPHYVLNFRKVFREKVIENFCQEYKEGRTPNPCIRCNEYIKFEALLKKAPELDAHFVATGHYARIEYDKKRERYFLKKGVDVNKDQSYVLYVMNQTHLRATLMPLGYLTKEETRAKAKGLGLPVASKKESQEICFIPNDNYGKFLKGYIPEAVKPGPILDKQGNILGKHKGILFYTIGQRKGLGIAVGKPLYVIVIDKQKNVIVVGTETEAYAQELIATEVNYTAGPLIKPTNLKAKIRYAMEEQEALVSLLNKDKVKVRFEKPQWAPAPGQAVVFYADDVVIGGGTIL